MAGSSLRQRTRHSKVQSTLGTGSFLALAVSSWDPISSNLIDGRSKGETELIQINAGNFVEEIAHILARVPRPLLLVFKTNNLLCRVDFTLIKCYNQGAMLRTLMTTYRHCLQLVLSSLVKQSWITIQL